MIRSVDYTMKYVIVGNSSVGKSALLCRFVDNEFNPFFLSTIGVDFKFRNLEIDDKICKVQIWDTAGQENFRAIISTYYNGADAIVVTYDMTSNESFNDLASYWMDQANAQRGGKTEIMVLGTKRDLEEKRVVEEEKVRELCAKHNITLCFQTSSKTGEGVDESFIELTKRIIQKRKNNAQAIKTTTTKLGDPSTVDKIQQKFNKMCCKN